MEIKFVKDAFDTYSLQQLQEVMVGAAHLWVSSLPLQIAYKRYVLLGKKDLEDATHLQQVFSIDEKKIVAAKQLLKQYGKLE